MVVVAKCYHRHTLTKSQETSILLTGVKKTLQFLTPVAIYTRTKVLNSM